jgi:hypothetical protein
MNCILDDCSFRPRPCPFTNDAVARDAIVEATYQASLGLFGVAREQKRKLLEFLKTLIEDCVKILVSGVQVCFSFTNLNGGLFSHVFVSRRAALACRLCETQSSIWQGVRYRSPRLRRIKCLSFGAPVLTEPSQCRPVLPRFAQLPGSTNFQKRAAEMSCALVGES